MKQKPQQTLITDPEKYQRSLLKAVLLIIFVFSMLIGSINFLLFEAYIVGSFNYASALFSVLIWLYFSRSNNLLIASWLVSAVVIFNLGSFIVVAKAGAYSLIWVTVLPPLIFFLLGRRAGSWITGLSFIAVLAYFYVILPTLPSYTLTLGAWLNVAEVLALLWLIFRHYEGSRRHAFEELERLSTTDKLTGIHNRAKLDYVLDQQLAIHRRTELPLAVLLLDIDWFKKINDRFGHLEGDSVLCKVATLLNGAIRKTDYFGRWGGEEFMLICPNTNQQQGYHLAEKLRMLVANHTWPAGQHITISIGMIEVQPEMANVQVIQNVDQALYAAKNSGRNCVKVLSETSFPEGAI